MGTREVIQSALRIDQPIILWGAPGTGKTAYIQALAARLCVHLETLIGSTLDPPEVGGFLVPDARGQVTASPPPWAKRILSALNGGTQAWLFLDEFSCSPPSVQAALLRVIHERKVGELDLVGCRIIAASNPVETAADGGTLSAATSGRLASVEWSLSSSDWIVGELSGWGRPVSGPRAKAASRVTDWVQRQPQALLQVPTGDTSQPWPSPRSWSAAIKMLAEASKDDERASVGACVGPAATNEWAAYDMARDLPDPESVLSGREKLPKRGDAVWATLSGVVGAALSEHEQRTGRILRAWQILASARPDVAIMPARALFTGQGEDVEIPKEAADLGWRLTKATGYRG